MFLGRYAHQPASLLEHEPITKVYSWARCTSELLREEAEELERARRGH